MTTQLQTPDELIVKTFPVGHLKCNCTIIGNLRSKEALVIDPGGDADKILAFLKERDLTIKNVVHTHAHFDHILASGNLKKSTGCRLSLHPDDRLLWDHLEDQCRLFGVPYSPLPAPDSDLNHEEELHVGTCLGKALHTPGHTPGSMSFHFPEQKLLIAGDTLFRGSIGRTDLWGGDFSKINNSIRNILYRLDEETTVVTGHGPQTTIGYELRHNQIIRGV